MLWLKLHHLCLSILGEVEHHRTWTSATGDIERTTHSPGDILSMTNLITPLRDRLGHTHEVYLLKSICSQSSDGHLTSYHHNRRRIQHGIGHTRQRVRGTRTTCYQRHTNLATYSGKALCRMGSSLFVAHQYMVERFLVSSRVVVEGIVNGHNRTAWVSEDGLHPLGLQCQHQRLTTCYLLFLHNS